METLKTEIERSRAIFVSARHVEENCILHLHPHPEIVLVTDGILEMTVKEKEYRIPPTYGIFVPPFAPHRFCSSRGNCYHVLEFAGELVPFFFRYIKTHEPTSHIFAVSPPSLALARATPNSRGEPDYIAAQGVLAPLCHEIAQKCGFISCDNRKEDICRDAVSYMWSHFTEPLSLATVAHAVGAHPVTLSKVLAARLGIHFHSYLQYLRCAHALGLIRTEVTPLTDIAYRSGFSSIRSFNRSFLTVYGKPPSAYRTE